MKAEKSSIRSVITEYVTDPLRRNTIFLIAGGVVSSIFGFFFWMVAARFYPPSSVGLAVAAISAVNLLALISDPGLGIGIMRFLHDEKDKPAMINSCLTISGLIALFLALVFIGGLNIWSPALLFIQQDLIFLLVFVLLTIIATLFWLHNDVFVAFRAAHFSLIQMLIFGLRILLLVFLVRFGTLGIVSSWIVAMGIAVIAASFFISRLHPGYHPVPVIRRETVNRIVHFSFANYIGDSLRLLPGLILPIMVVNVASQEMSAYFYMGWMIAALLFMTAYYTGYSLLVEVSHNPQELRVQVMKAARLILLILIPAIIVILFAGDFLLSLFGSGYAEEASELLRVLTLSSIPVAINELYIAVGRVEKKIKPIIYIYAFIAIATVGGGYLLLDALGLIGIGIAWLVSHTMVMLIVMPLLARKTEISVRGLLGKLSGRHR